MHETIDYLSKPENGSIKELKGVSRVGSNETASRCTAIQFLLSGVPREDDSG